MQEDESPRHYRYKWRLFQILLRAGCWPVGLECRYPCKVDGFARPKRHAVDIHGSLGGEGCREINVEVDGYEGHKTTRAFNLDKLKARRIRENYGKHIETYHFTFARLARWTDQEIAEEMHLVI